MTRQTIGNVLQVAKEAALRGAEVVREVRCNGTEVKRKGIRDLVTEADVRAERAILEVIREAFPDHGVLAEESAPELLPDRLARGPLWIIDPVDGTTNFAHGHSQVGVSIAFIYDGVPEAGVVAAPFQNEIFEAARGSGAFLNGAPIRPSKTATLVDALVCTGFPYGRDNLNPILERVGKVLANCRDLRRLGACSLDLCWVAAGRLDAYYEDVCVWDMAAAALIAREAGTICAPYLPDHPFNRGIPTELQPGALLAANPALFPQFETLLREEL